MNSCIAKEKLENKTVSAYEKKYNFFCHVYVVLVYKFKVRYFTLQYSLKGKSIQIKPLKIKKLIKFLIKKIQAKQMLV